MLYWFFLYVQVHILSQFDCFVQIPDQQLNNLAIVRLYSFFIKAHLLNFELDLANSKFHTFISNAESFKPKVSHFGFFLLYYASVGIPLTTHDHTFVYMFIQILAGIHKLLSNRLSTSVVLLSFAFLLFWNVQV